MMEVSEPPILPSLVGHYTLEAFFELPRHDGYGLELIDGLVYMTPPPDWTHTDITSRLVELLIGEINRLKWDAKVFTPRGGIQTAMSWVEPDIFILTREQLATFNGQMPTTATVVIEILSPSTKKYDLTLKSNLYASLGVQELWLINPQTRQIEVRSAGNLQQWESVTVYAQTAIQADTLQSRFGLSVPLAPLFS